jgi:hypothetical protein
MKSLLVKSLPGKDKGEGQTELYVLPTDLPFFVHPYLCLAIHRTSHIR